MDELRQLVNILWSDEHSSSFALSWLKDRDFSPKTREKYLSEWYRPASKHWGKHDFVKVLKQFDYWDVMRSDAGEHLIFINSYGEVSVVNINFFGSECVNSLSISNLLLIFFAKN